MIHVIMTVASMDTSNVTYDIVDCDGDGDNTDADELRS